jgi:SAM-dependent methyltransferase
MTTWAWDERFREGEYPQDPDPSEILKRYVGTFPEGRALDVATGTGRNAVFLAERGYEVDAVDRSREGLRIARENARERGVADRMEWIQTDVPNHAFPEGTYDVITISYYRAVDRFPDIKEALAPGGVLYVEHHLRSTDEAAAGPSSDRYRFASNELLHACLDLTVIHYQETNDVRDDGGLAPNARVVARKTTGTRQSYPTVE